MTANSSSATGTGRRIESGDKSRTVKINPPRGHQARRRKLIAPAPTDAASMMLVPVRPDHLMRSHPLGRRPPIRHLPFQGSFQRWAHQGFGVDRRDRVAGCAFTHDSDRQSESTNKTEKNRQQRGGHGKYPFDEENKGVEQFWLFMEKPLARQGWEIDAHQVIYRDPRHPPPFGFTDEGFSDGLFSAVMLDR